MNINGITPAAMGDNWFHLDKSGTFSPDTSVWAYIWLVGGGCDGEDGYYKENNNTACGGKGGDGGYVFKFGKIVLFKNTQYSINVADVNDKTGTNITANGNFYTCSEFGTTLKGGSGAIINKRKLVVNPQNGISGQATPYGYVGSSGGGGSTVYKDFSSPFGKGGNGAGNGRNKCDFYSEEILKNFSGEINAANYGCGGGGNTFCYDCSKTDIGLKSKGMGGCVIISYEPYDENFPDLTIRYWQTIDTGGKKKNAQDDIEILKNRYTELLSQNKELKEQIESLEREEV